MQVTLNGIFSQQASSKPSSDTGFRRLVERNGVNGFRIHRFRSGLSDGFGEEATLPSEVAGRALAHAIENEFERTDQCGNTSEKRRNLRGCWAQFCPSSAPVSKVVPLHG
ncbi:hypothetical protein [Hyphomonas sp.]|uniref:hypothetical protein n=1 Tax=Hyphomonas sp. TaxID=87 RepID=UPI0032EAFC4A